MEPLGQAIVGFLAGLLGGLLGIGGSIIIIPALVVYLSHTAEGYGGDTQHLIQAAAMICNVFVAAPAVLAHYRAKALIKPVVVLLIPFGIVGIVLGVATSNSSAFARDNGVYLAMIYAGFLLYVAVYNTWRLLSKVDFSQGFDPDRRIPWPKTASVGLTMGFLGGMLGIGGGVVAVPMQQILLRMPLRRAVANSAATIMVVSTLGAVYKNATLPTHGIAVWASVQLALALIPTAVLGSYLGGRMTHALPRTALRVIFLMFMILMAYLTFIEAWAAWQGRA